MQTSFEGRVWTLTNAQGQLIDHIDTDMIFHNRYLHITAVSEMGPYALDSLVGWEDFSSKAQPGDIVVAGRNFGCGSSRQQAVDCFRALGIAALVAQSYGAIYYRNAVNTGWPVLQCEGLSAQGVGTGDNVRLDGATGRFENLTRGLSLPPITRVSDVQLQIMAAGGLFHLRSPQVG